MKRFLTTGLVILSLATAGVAYASHDLDTVSPQCADLGGGGFSLTGGVVSGSLQIDDEVNSCTSITYTLYVTFATPGGKLLTRSDSVQGNGTPVVGGFSIRVPVFVTSVESYATSTDASGSLLDRGPDTGTITITSGSGGGSGYN
jgi:hypothetical protein